MPVNLRLATFNCENLFSRPRVFRESAERSRELLDLVSKLQEELKRPVFDHAKIKELLKELQGYATLNELRGSYQTAAGASEWLGWVELSRDENRVEAVQNTARVIADVDADVICLVEVENRLGLQKFHDDVLVEQFLQPAGKRGYEHVLLIDGNDERGIDVAVMSRLPVLWLRSHIHEHTDYLGRQVRTFSRDCLEVRVKLPARKQLHLLLNHFKSKRFSSADRQDPQGRLRRAGQARRVRELVDEHDLARELVVVAGDFNDTPDSEALAPLVGTPGLYNVNLELPATQRGTFQNRREQIDYLLVSDRLRAGLRQVRIERRGIFTPRGERYDTVVDARTQASDHAAVVADFQL